MIEQFIRASAGTGKTHALLKTIFQYDEESKTPTVDYTQACQRINESVFLTFSNSAAAEIRNRIYKGLALCKGHTPTDLHHALTQQDVHIRVYTIHAFALEMLRLFRYKLGLPSDLRFTEEDEPLWPHCVKEFFAKQWNQKSLRQLVKPADPTAHALLDVFFLLSNRGTIQDFITQKGNTLYFLAAMGKSFGFDLPSHSAQVQALLKNNLGLDVTADYSEPLLQVRNTLLEVKERELYKETNQERDEQIATKLKALAAKEQEQNELAEKQQQKGLTARQAETLAKTNERIEKLKQEIGQLKQEREKYLLLQNVCPVLDTCSYFIEQIVLAIGNQLYMPRMLANGIFDFDAVVFLFIKELLRGDVNAFMRDLQAENQAFHRLYIDEAQDNDIIQNYLIVLFGQGKCKDVKLYVVGDLKQSIYTWRNAYPREFEQMLHECNESADRERLLKNLHTSYRLKEQNTCDVINRICGAVQQKYPGWWYQVRQDDLKLPKNLPKTYNGKIEMWYSARRGILSLSNGPDPQQDQFAVLDTFFASGKTAVAVRSRNHLANVPDLKEKLKKLGANYKLSRSIADKESNSQQAKAHTLQPELELLALLFMALTEGKAEQVPFALFWAESGKVLAERLQLCRGDKMSVDFKAVFEKIYQDIAKGVAGNRVQRVLHLFDKYNLWTYLCHTDLPEDVKDARELRRIFCHILTRAQLAENKFNCHTDKAFYSDPVWAIIKEGKIAGSCYTLAEDFAPAREEAVSVPDVITIHGSKGLAYDNMIVVADFANDFFGKADNFNKYGPAYKQLFKVDFDKILSDEPQLRVSFFPYLGGMTAYVLRNKDTDTQNEFWKKLDATYQNIEQLIRSEQFNLLYVALTRTSKNLLLLDIGAADEKSKEPFIAAGVRMREIHSDKVVQEDPPAVKYTYQDVTFSRMKIDGPLTTRSVRSEITGKIYRKYGRHLSCLERLRHAKKGSMVHNVLQRLISQAGDANDFVAKAQALIAPENSLYTQAVQLVASNRAVLEQNQDLLGNYTFYHEVPVWQFNPADGTLTKGSIDTLAVGADKAVIVEYKVGFKNGHDQQAQAQAQLQRYERILRALETGYSLEKRALELKEYGNG